MYSRYLWPHDLLGPEILRSQGETEGAQSLCRWQCLCCCRRMGIAEPAEGVHKATLLAGSRPCHKTTAEHGAAQSADVACPHTARLCVAQVGGLTPSWHKSQAACKKAKCGRAREPDGAQLASLQLTTLTRMYRQFTISGCPRVVSYIAILQSSAYMPRLNTTAAQRCSRALLQHVLEGQAAYSGHLSTKNRGQSASCEPNSS